MDFTRLIFFALCALPPVLLWVVFWRRRFNEPESTGVLVQLFFLGVLSALPLLWLRNYLDTHADFQIFSWIDSTTVLIICFALLEEALKALLLILGVEFNKRRFDKWEDGFEFAVLVALGFAFTENILYCWEIYLEGALTSSFWSAYFFRSLGTMLGHMLFTGTFGYFYACAYVEKGLVPLGKREKPLMHLLKNFFLVLRRPLHITVRHLWPQKDSARGHNSGEVILEGFLLAALLHAIFNLLFFWTAAGKSLGFLTIPILLFVAAWYFRRFKKSA